MSGTVVVVSPLAQRIPHFEECSLAPKDASQHILESIALLTPEINTPQLRQIDPGLLRLTKDALCPVPTTFEDLQNLKRILCHGTDPKRKPFSFDTSAGHVKAITLGLEGFLHTEAIVSRQNPDALVGWERNYETDVCNLLRPIPHTRTAIEVLHKIVAQQESKSVIYAQVIYFLGHYTEALRQRVMEYDQSRWLRSARIYQIFPRVFNLKGRREALGNPTDNLSGHFLRDVTTEDLQRVIVDKGNDTVWLTGTYPIGTKHAKGMGSPYSISNHRAINPELGDADELRAFVQRVKSLDPNYDPGHPERPSKYRVILDWVPNHTSWDADLLREHPEWYIQIPAQPGQEPPPNHRVHTYVDQTGQEKTIWIHWAFGVDEKRNEYKQMEIIRRCGEYADTAQLNLAYRDAEGNYPVQEYWIETLTELIEQYGVDGFRCDMIEALTNDIFEKKFEAHGVDMGPVECLERIWSRVKSKNPRAAALGESYCEFDVLSKASFDLVQGKNPVGPSLGWFDPWLSGTADNIAAALERVIHLQQQVGGSSVMIFPSDHDRESAAKIFGAKYLRVLAASRLLPGSLTYGGDETLGGKEKREDGEFFDAEPANWNNPDPNHEAVDLQLVRLRKMGFERALPLPRKPGSPWAGFLLAPESAPKRRGTDLIVDNEPSLAGVAVVVPLLDAQNGPGYNGEVPRLRIPLFDQRLGLHCTVTIDITNPDSVYVVEIPAHTGLPWKPVVTEYQIG